MLKKQSDIKMTKRISMVLIVLALIALSSTTSSAQGPEVDEFGDVIEEKDVYVYHYDPQAIGLSANLSTMTLVGDNPARVSFVDVHSDAEGNEDVTYGGSLSETQSGIDFKFIIPLANDKLHIPVGIDYIWCHAAELENLPQDKDADRLLMDYKANIFSMYSGIQYDLIEFPEYHIRIHGDLLAFGSYYHNYGFKAIFKKGNGDVVSTVIQETKDNAFRLGMGVNFGAEARVLRGLFFNWDLGLNCYNLIGRDDKRGQLLTPHTISENQEDLLFGYTLKIGLLYYLSFEK